MTWQNLVYMFILVLIKIFYIVIKFAYKFKSLLKLLINLLSFLAKKIGNKILFVSFKNFKLTGFITFYQLIQIAIQTNEKKDDLNNF